MCCVRRPLRTLSHRQTSLVFGPVNYSSSIGKIAVKLPSCISSDDSALLLVPSLDLSETLRWPAKIIRFVVDNSQVTSVCRRLRFIHRSYAELKHFRCQYNRRRSTTVSSYLLRTCSAVFPMHTSLISNTTALDQEQATIACDKPMARIGPSRLMAQFPK